MKSMLIQESMYYNYRLIVKFIDNNIDRKYFRIQSPFPSNVIQIPGVVEANKNLLILQNGSTINDADILIYCTGYLTTFPFLDPESKITITNNHVKPLYRHMININYPSMAFIGLAGSMNFFSLVYNQVN